MTIKLVLEKREKQELSFTAKQNEPVYKESTILYQESKRSGRTSPKGNAKGPSLSPEVFQHR